MKVIGARNGLASVMAGSPVNVWIFEVLRAAVRRPEQAPYDAIRSV
jgi:hypothetical protein